MSTTLARVGAQMPARPHQPLWVTNLGEDAISLAEVAGLHLDEWQQNVLTTSLGMKSDDRFACRDMTLIVPRQNGKTELLVARELAGLYLLKEPIIAHSAHEFKTTKESHRKLCNIIDASPYLRKKKKQFRNSGVEVSVELTNGCRVLFVARSRGSLRGFPVNTVILDEAYNLNEEQLDAMGPTQAAIRNPQMWFVSSTGMDESVVLKRMSDAGRNGAASMGYFEWKADDNCDPADREQWFKANPALGIRISEDFLASQYDKMSAEGFAREHLGLWADNSLDSVITKAQWADTLDDRSRIVGSPAVAIHCAPDNRSAAVYVAGMNKDDFYHVECAAVDVGTMWVPEYVKSLVARINPRSVCLDAGSPSGALIPALNNLGVKFEALNATDVMAACSQFYNMVDGGRLRHRDDTELEAAVNGSTKRLIGVKGGWAWDGKTELDDITYLVSATYAVYGFTAFEPERERTGKMW